MFSSKSLIIEFQKKKQKTKQNNIQNQYYKEKKWKKNPGKTKKCELAKFPFRSNHQHIFDDFSFSLKLACFFWDSWFDHYVSFNDLDVCKFSASLILSICWSNTSKTLSAKIKLSPLENERNSNKAVC